MKFHFNERQRFSLRKYSFGLASVLLGTAFFLSGQVTSADEAKVSETVPSSVLSAKPDSSNSTSESSAPETADSKPTVADKAVVTPETTEVSSDSEKVATENPKSEKSEASAKESSEETAKATEVKAEVAEKDDKSTDKAPAEVAEKDDKSTDKAPAPAEARRSTRTRRATSENKREVSNWSEFVSALEDGNVSEITVNGDVVAQGDNGNTDNGRPGSVDRKTTINAPSRPVTIQGKNENARLELLSHTLELTGASWELNLKNLKIATANSKGPIDLSRTSGSNTVTFENVTSVGSSLYGGGGNTHVVIKGNTTSTVSDSYQAANGQTQHVQRNVGVAGRSDKRRESNIHDAKSVTVAEGASLTLNRSSQGDAITLESGAKVSVKDKASLTINMNTDNRTDSARYHNAGIFMADSGTVETGKGSKLVLNTSIGQGISIGINRPGDGVTDKDRFGGYGPNNNGRKNGPSRVLIGEEGTFEFNGRDGIMMGNNSELVTGQDSKVRFENRGRGVALDFGNDSRVAFGKHSTNTFHSDGKGPRSGGGPSGSYDGYNYIGLNENGKILVDDFATFRVQMDNRGDNAWDDVISLGSQNGTKSEPLFQANKGSIVDIRDDNTNYYAELISVALGSSKNTVFQFNNPLYVSFMRYTNSQGLSAGEITGKLPVSIPQGNNPQDIGHGNILYISDKSQASRNRVEFNGPASQNGGSTVGTYTVYSMNKDGRDQQTKDKQSSVWTNIQGGSLPIAGFQSGRPDIQPANAASVPTGSSSGGVSATDRTFGIDPVGDNRQNIWVSNGSKINPTGVHKNIIKYVYEDGTPVKKDVIQSSEWNRTLDVSIDKEGFEKILRNSSVRNGDEFLAAYSKAKYHISDIDGDNIADTGWKVDGTNSGIYNYGTIASPKVEGYEAEIKSSNVPGLKAGANADSVSVSYDSSNAPETLIDAQAGKRTVSETYWRNIVAKSDLGVYETVVVYKKVKQKAIVKYIDTSDNNKELAKDEVEGKSGEAINYSTEAKITDFVNKGYKLVEDGFTNSTADQKKFDDDKNIDQEFVVKLKHDVTPVGPNNPHNPTDPINPNDPNSPKYPATDQWKKDVTSTVHYVVSDGKATAPADNVQNAQWTRTLNVDKVTGKVLNPDATWTANKTNYDAVPTPGLTGYYADKGSVASKTVTQENLEETVTYKPLGNLVPKPETPNDPNFPSTPGVKYPNDPTDPTKPGQPVVPDVPGYEPHLPDPKDPTKPGKSVPPGTPITPDKPGEDTPIIYVPKTTEVTKPTKQTVTFEGAGTATPADKVQDNFTFTGKQKNGTTTWDQPNHTYGKETVPVVEHYYADKKEAGSKTVTPDQPEVTDKVTYKPLGKIIPVDPEGNPIPKAPTPQYNNDPQDPTKGGETPTPVIPGYVTDTPSVTPNKPGEDTPVVYRKAEQKAIIKYVDQNTGKTLENDQVSGKSGEAIDYSTAAKIKKYQDRGYVLVSDEFPAGATYDTDASVDQTWTVTLKHGETPVGPNDPHNPTDPINPNDPNSPKYPATDQWKKDVTSTVHYVVSDGKATAPADNVQNAQWTRTLNVDKVTGEVLNPDAPWTANKTNYDAVPTPGLTGYYADKGSVASKTVTQENLEETVTYKPLGNLVPKPETPNDPNFPSTPEVKYPNDPTDPTKPGQPVVPDVPGYEPHLPDPKDPTKPGKSVPPGTPITPDKPGEDTPIIYVPKTTEVTKPTKQTVTFEGAGTATPADKVQDNFTFTGKQKNGTTTWDQPNHTYGKETVPVVEHYYADKKEAGSKTVTPDQPEVTDKVTYKPLGKIIPVDPEGNKIPSAPTPQYNNDPQDPTKGGETPTPVIPGYVTDTPSVTPNKPGEDTPVVYRKAEQKAIIKYVDQNTGKTLENDQVSGKSGEAIDYSTAAKIKKYQDRGYVLVSDEFPAGATYDTDASVDQTWTVTLKHGETPVGPNDPHNPTDPINPNDPNSPKYPATDQWKKDVTSTVHYVVSDGKATAPADNVQNAQWTRTLNVDKVTGEVLNPDAPWTANKTNYDAVPTPGLTGYYADKGSVASKTVTQENLEETVTYKPLGNLVPKPETPNDPNFPSTPEVKYPNDPTDPTKPGQPVVPDVPGYEPHLPDPKDPTKPGKSVPPGTPITPDKPGEDTPIIYVPKTTKVTKPTKQTVTFEGAGTATPADKVQDNFTFTGKQKNGTTTWDQPNHTYGKETVPVVEHYYADKKEAGSKTVTPDQPEVTDKVTYKPLGKIIPVDPEGNPIPKAPTPQYNNDPQDPTKGGKTPTPDIPGYVTDIPSVTPDKPGEDTKVVYRKAEQKAIIKYVDQNTGKTLENDQVSGKSGEAIDYSTAAKIKYYEDRGYVLVSDEFPAGATYDTDASRDQTWTVTLKHGETPVGPNNPLKPTDPINPNDPNSPKYPAEDQWKKDVTSTVHYVVSDGNATAPADNVQNAQWTRTLTLDKVTGEVLSSTPWASNKTNYDAVPTPGLTGYYADKGSVASKTVTQENLEETVTYKPLGNLVPKPETPNDPNFPSKPGVKYPNNPTDPTKPGQPLVPDVPGYEPHLPDPKDPTKPGKSVPPGTPITPEKPGEDTPIIYVPKTTKVTKPTKQTVTFEGAGTATPADKVQDNFTFTGKQKNGTTTWDQPNHTYGKETVPVVEHYYADKKEAGSKTVTPDQPEVTDKVTYKALGKIIQVDEAGNVIPGSVSKIYENNPSNPTEAAETKIPDAPAGYKIKEEQPQVWGYNIVDKTIEPNDESDPDRISRDTPIIYVPIVNDVKKPTKQTVTFEGAGTVTPADKVQDNFTFTGKQKNGTTTWDQPKHTYGKETVPVVEHYYADKKEAGSKTVTPDQPEVTDKVTYKPLGKIIPVDPEGNPIPKAPTPQYNNDSEDPTKGGKTPTPDIPGYVTDTPSVTPNEPGKDTPVVYRKAEQKAIIKYVDQNTSETLENDQVGGKSGEAINYSTAAKIKYYEDRGYVLVKDEFPAGATYDTDASVDQTWTVTLKHGETPVGPNDPHKPTDPINPNDPDGPKYPAENQWKKDVTSTVHYVVSDGKATAPADNVQNAQWTRTLNVDKVTGKVLNPNEPWTANKANYDAVPTPGLEGYYADKGSVASKTVTQENLEETVTYKPLGNLVPKPETPNDPNFPSKPGVKYPNDPTDPTKPGQPLVPDVPGYEPHLPDPKDPTKPGKSVPPGTPITPDKPGEDTPIIYVPKTTKVTKPTKQTVTFEGAGTATPADKVQDNFTFTGKQKNGTTTWDQPKHTYGKETVPVVEHYYADKKEAGSKTVTPEHPEVTDKVVYKELGKIIPVDPEGNKIPSAPTPQYTNDPNDPTKGGVTPTPVIPGYVTDIPNVTPSNPGADTPVVYRKAEQKAVIKYVDQTTGQTLANDQVGGKSGEAINYSTADKIKYYEDRGYVLVSDEFPTGAHFDNDASVDQTWTVTLKHGETPVGPNDPHNPTDPINPNDPNSPKYPAEDQWKKDVTSTVHYVGAGSQTPADNVQNAQWTRTLQLDKVTGKVLNPDEAWTTNKTNYDAVPTPSVTGYYADKASVASKTVTQENLEETVTYKPLGNLVPKPGTPDDPNFPSTPKVKYPNDPTDPGKPGKPVVPNVPGYKPYLPDPKDPSKPGKPVEPGKPITPENPGEDTPIIYVPIVNDVKKPTKQTVKFEGAGDKTPGDNVQDDFTFTGKENKASGTTTWNEKSHTYGKVSVPVIPGYYADKTEAGGKTVTPENPEATDTVTYKPLGNLVPKPGTPDDPNFPSTPKVKYPNDPTDPGKPGKPVVPNVPGYKPYLPDPKDPSKPGKPVEPGKPITPENPGEDTPIIYVPIVNDVKKPTKQTVKFEGAGDKTPGDNVQDDFTFTGKENKASGTTTWNEKSHTYGKVSVPVIPGYYADKTEAGGKTVTPENPEAIDTVTYKPLGNLVPKPGTPDDPNFPSTPKVKYPNDPTDPGKPGKPVVPNVPGYKPYLPDPKDPSKPGKPVEPGKPITPENPGDDTPIIYVPIVNDVKKPTKQTVKFEGAGDKTPGDNVQDDFTFTGKENKASGTTTWNEKSHTYGKVSVPVIPGYYADKTEAGGKTVTPENPEATDTVTYKPLGNLVPKPGTPDDPNFPSTPKVKYPNDPKDPSKPGQPVVPNVPGYKPYLPDPKDPSKPGKPVEPGKPITPENPGEDTPIIYVPIVNDVKKPTKQTVKFEGAGDKTPGDNVQDDFTFTGKENKASGTTTWNEKSHTYGKVSVPVIPGYYADKTEAGGKTVTPENPEATDTVTYKPLGNLVPKPGTPDDPNFPSTPKVKYPNDPTDPGKPGQPVVPNVPGYKPYLPDPKDPSKPGKPVEPGKPITPENPGEDTPIIYVPIVNDVKKPTKQTVKFEGAGDKTPGDNVQDDFTFTGKENKASGTTTWNEKSHTYGKVSVPVIPGYYADKTEAGGKTVTPENPEATDTVTYKPLGNLVPKPGTPDDPNFPSTPKVKYPNDPTDPGKPGQPVVPNVPGYKPYLPDPKDPSKPGKPVEPGKPITPENPGEDTPIIYVPIVNDVKKPTKQTVKFEGAGDKTPGDNVQDGFTFTGKENKASGTTTWNEKSHTYGKVSVPVIPGYYADKTEAGGKTVTPENPEATDTVTYKPLGNLVPKPGTPDDPNFPSTPKVKYPNDPTDPGKPGQPVVPNVPGYKPYLPDPKDPSKPGKPVEPGKPITPENPGEDTPIIYVPIVNDVKKPTKQTVKFEGAGDKTPGDNVQDDFTFTGKENKASGTTTWNEKSHTYGKVSVPVIPGYYADKTEAGGKTVTPENPEAIDTVTYKPLGNLVPKPGTPDDPNFPSTPKVKYPNDPTDPGKPGQPVVPNVPGYKPYLPDPKDPSKPGKPVEPGKPITPENPGEDTPIIYVPIVNDVKKPTKQTVKFEGAGDKTPGDNVQDDFTFTGKENKASGTTTWNEKSHTYGKVSVPVIPGYYADKTEAGGKTVTPENPEATDTVTYKPLGSLVPKSDDPKFPSTPDVKYPNDPKDPSKPGQPVVPDVPGYKPYLPDPKDPSKPGKPVEPGKPITPENPGDDTPIIYVPVKPDTPVVPNPEPQTPAKPDPKPLDPEKVVQELPNTGTDSNAIMTGLGIIGMATTLLGLAQKKKED